MPIRFFIFVSLMELSIWFSVRYMVFLWPVLQTLILPVGSFYKYSVYLFCKLICFVFFLCEYSGESHLQGQHRPKPHLCASLPWKWLRDWCVKEVRMTYRKLYIMIVCIWTSRMVAKVPLMFRLSWFFESKEKIQNVMIGSHIAVLSVRLRDI